MSYTATKVIQPRLYPYPKGQDFAGRTFTLRGSLVENDTATEYAVGGVGQSAFEVTAFSAVGLVTYSNLKGLPLVNGQKATISNTGSNTNDGTYLISQLTPSSATAGTFVAVPSPTPISGSAQTTQTAEGVGGFLFGSRQLIPQTFTATAVVAQVGGFMKVTYTTLVGPQLTQNDSVYLAGMTNPGNNGGPFVIVSATPTSSTAGSFIVQNPNAVSSDSGTGTGNFQAGAENYAAANPPVTVKIFSNKGYTYVWNDQNQTIQIFLTGTASGDPSNEAALGATVAFDGTMKFEAVFDRGTN